MHKILIISYLLFLSVAAYSDEYSKRREEMVRLQIEERGVQDTNVLKALREVPRHLFVPDTLKGFAYEDRPLPIGYGQTISQPYIVALMTELIKPAKIFKVLEIGTGSGYQAAILSRLVKEVYTVEIISKLLETAEIKFSQLNYTNIFTLWGDGYYGWEKHSPYDAIVVTCAVEFVPPPLIKQLKAGGSMIIPVGPPFHTQELLLIRKTKDGNILTDVIGNVLFVSMTREKK